MSVPSISYISQMLENPQNITDAEAGEINALLETYPYFIPGYLLEAARMQQQHPFSAEVIDVMHATNANWLLIHEFLEKVRKSDVLDIPLHVKQPAAAVPVNDIISEDIEIPEEEVKQLVEEENTTEDDILAELFQKKDEQEPSQQTPANEVFTRNSDFFAEEPGMDIAGNDLIHEEDFGHLEPVGDEDTTSSLWNGNVEKDKEEEEQQPLSANEEHVDSKSGMHTSIPEELSIQGKLDEYIPLTDDEAQGDTLIKPIYTEDYFLHEGVEISTDLPAAEDLAHEQDDKYKSLMVMMSFAEWLNYYKTKSQVEKEEDEDKKALKSMWQKEKLKAALEEENDEIPEQVFEMAVNSITQDDGLASESMAEIYAKQGKYDKAIEMYRKLSLRNPQKNTYFARKIEEVLKEKRS